MHQFAQRFLWVCSRSHGQPNTSFLEGLARPWAGCLSVGKSRPASTTQARPQTRHYSSRWPRVAYVAFGRTITLESWIACERLEIANHEQTLSNERSTFVQCRLVVWAESLLVSEVFMLEGLQRNCAYCARIRIEHNKDLRDRNQAFASLDQSNKTDRTLHSNACAASRRRPRRRWPWTLTAPAKRRSPWKQARRSMLASVHKA